MTALLIVLFVMTCAGWLCFFVAESAYSDLKNELNNERRLRRNAEATLTWHKYEVSL